MNTRPHTAARVLLLTLLLAMQGVGLAHQLDHLAMGDSSPCAMCTAGSSLQHAVVDAQPEPVETRAIHVSLVHEIAGLTCRTEGIPLARSPPLFR